ncbi:probable mediator of RNA polymerase II transcription subunit 26c [Cryptomeria japonica]|uniref:probable mediator of RNA polymerase II transcription subunit 26c n=1 Tax=Cryptomeria japonica TaxID=3369 RepID=UPI0027D9F38C|nr:probable mediator of RNA polymerase II transcription subunit 26c [Cryptomeria japonica]
MALSIEILKETMIGRNVKCLQKHKSKPISSMAKKLVRRWREVADEWMKSAGEVAVDTMAAAVEQIQNHRIEQPFKLDDRQYSKQETKSGAQNHIVINHRRRRVVSQKQNLHQKLDFNKPSSLPLPSSHKSNSPALDDKSVRERIEAAKRRLQEGYRQAEKVKKQRTVQLIEIKDLPKQLSSPVDEELNLGSLLCQQLDEASWCFLSNKCNLLAKTISAYITSKNDQSAFGESSVLS